MVFSSPIFIFAFLPVTLAGYYILHRWRILQNIWLVIVSLMFYAWGEPKNVLLMIASIIFNYIFGLLVDKYRDKKSAVRVILALMVITNIGVLFVYKYLGFACSILGIKPSFGTIALPIGISFYTFQAISYVIDVYKERGEAQKNPLNVALYIAFFPQLIAGPIVRYQTIAEEIRNRRETFADFSYGVERFIVGLTKKIFFANSFASIVDFLFQRVPSLSFGSAWIGAICYTLQIYYDFSGYSDMAIGLGRMFGFKFVENFDYPYISRSVSEFWRRWHISLSSWFRDYVYIPLGGSRVKTKARLVFNLFVVWSLTGIWHGANWTFILWGIGYFVVLTFEKLTELPQRLKKLPGKIIYQIFTIICVIFGWVIFRADSLQQAKLYMSHMFAVGCKGIDTLALFLLKDMWLLLILGVVMATPIMKKLAAHIRDSRYNILYDIVHVVVYMGLFLVDICYMVNSSYNPFIYFNF